MSRLTTQQQYLINEISESYALLQKRYTEWAGNFSTYDDVIQSIEKKKIKVDGIQRQFKFNMHSAHWNGITLPIIKKVAQSNFKVLKQQFNELFNITHKEEYRIIWYCLFFIHPVRHELYYFHEHYTSNYTSRLAKLLRSHRMGLKAAQKYLVGKNIIVSEDSFIKACGTTAFKHILLHPTTERWQFKELDLRNMIKSLNISNGNLSKEEMTTANILARQGSLQFDQWISYAPCAINEGPVFTTKEGSSIIQAFDSITDILSSNKIAQFELRQCLENHFYIQELTTI
ncbi:MAG: hypothetical protein HQK64_07425 [Desulfamplus sp.]|nr:hypothetical protein [Desulfamplus sp.]MBF0389495.1 hypothetical protein [Desulfamplus sp.]